MPYLNLQISPDGPLCDAVFGVSSARRLALQTAGQTIPKAIRVRALIDTGASCTCVDPSVSQDLSLVPTGQAQMATPSTGTTQVHYANQYDVSILIPHPTLAPLIFQTVAVAEAELLLPQGFHALIGRDVLETCLLIYDGQNGLFTLAY